MNAVSAARSRWIPWAFVGGFAVVFAANAVMVTFAMRSWTGLETEDAYRKGLSYNRTLQAVRQEAALGWTGSAAFDGADIVVALRDREGAPVTAASVRADFVRPTAEGHDFSVSLTERGGGRYAASVLLPMPGVWDVRAVAQRSSDSFQLNQRIVAAP